MPLNNPKTIQKQQINPKPNPKTIQKQQINPKPKSFPMPNLFF
jgi:hypothetical protein